MQQNINGSRITEQWQETGFSVHHQIYVNIYKNIFFFYHYRPGYTANVCESHISLPAWSCSPYQVFQVPTSSQG